MALFLSLYGEIFYWLSLRRAENPLHNIVGCVLVVVIFAEIVYSPQRENELRKLVRRVAGCLDYAYFPGSKSHDCGQGGNQNS